MNSIARKKDVWSSKFQSYVVIEEKRDDQEFFSNENTFCVGRGDGKKQTFVFDSVVEDDDRESLMLKMKKSLRLIRLGFNSSIYMNCNSKASDNNAELNVIRDQLQTLYEGFEKDEKNVENGIQSGGEILLFRSVKFSSYELFDNHIIDLSLQQRDEQVKVKSATVRKSDRYIQLLKGTVTNLIKATCPTIESAMAVVDNALQMRLYLGASPSEAPFDVKAADASRAIAAPPRLLGAIGCVFITAEVEQLVYTIASGESTTRQSTLEFALFPCADTLTFKPEKYESIHALRFGDFSPVSVIPGPSNPDDVKLRNNKLLVSLQSGLQSLSSLTRVVKALRGDLIIGDTETSTLAIASTTAAHVSAVKLHVPYRDSLFTRLLKSSLHGNCNVFMVTTVNGGSENLTKSLRFASEIGSLYNNMWSNQTPGDTSSSTVPPEELQRIMRTFVSRAEGENTSISSDSCDKYRSIGTAKSHMIAFNDVLSDFQNSLGALVEFSATFLREDAEKEKVKCLNGMGITPGSIASVTVDDEDEDEKYSGGYDARLHELGHQNIGRARVEIEWSSERRDRQTTDMEDGASDRQSGSTKVRPSSVENGTTHNPHGVNGLTKTRPAASSFCITDLGVISSPKGGPDDGMGPTSQMQKELESFGIQFASSGAHNSLKSASMDIDTGNKRENNSKRLITVKSIENLQDMKGGDHTSKRSSTDLSALTRNQTNGEFSKRGESYANSSSKGREVYRGAAPGTGPDSSPVPPHRPLGAGAGGETDRASYRKSLQASGDSSSALNGKPNKSQAVRGGRSPTGDKGDGTSGSPVVSLQRAGSKPDHGSYRKAPLIKGTGEGTPTKSGNGTAQSNGYSDNYGNGNGNNNGYGESSVTDAMKEFSLADTSPDTAVGAETSYTTQSSDQRKDEWAPVTGPIDGPQTSPLAISSKRHDSLIDIDLDDYRTSTTVSQSASLNTSQTFSQCNSVGDSVTDDVLNAAKEAITGSVLTLPSINRPKVPTVKSKNSPALEGKGSTSGTGTGAKKGGKTPDEGGKGKSSRGRDPVTSRGRRGPNGRARGDDDRSGSMKSDAERKALDLNKSTELPALAKKVKRTSLYLIDDEGDGLDPQQRNFLHAVSQGKGAAVDEFLKGKVDCNVKNGFGRDAMQIAARNGSVSMLALILQGGGSINTRGPKGDTLFHLAAYNGHLPALKWLQSNGILPEAVDVAGQTAVHIACKRGEPQVLSYLNDEIHADFLQLDFEGVAPMDCIPRFGEDDEIKAKLAECRKIVTNATADIVRRNKLKEAADAKKEKQELLELQKISKSDDDQ